MMEALFLNHSSMLLKSGDEYLLADPWHEKPAFSSWMPSFPMATHPVYIASLDKVSILVSHPHQDHFDTDVIKLFNPDVPIISRFPWAGVEGRPFIKCNPSVDVGRFKIKSYACGDSDAAYTVESDGSLVLLANDNWNLSPEILAAVKADIGTKRVLYCSQVGSASGWPLNYRCYSEDGKKYLLAEKIKKMADTSLANAKYLGLEGYVAYAGYALPFVEGKHYHKQFDFALPEGALDFVPGDVWSAGEIRKAFIRPASVHKKAEEYYRLYGLVPEVSGEVAPGFVERLREFLKEFRSFGEKMGIKDKAFYIEIADMDYFKLMRFGIGSSKSTKNLYTTSAVMDKVLRGEMLFEALYTGYLGEWSRYPGDVHNQDITDAITAFSYVWMDKVKRKEAV